MIRLPATAVCRAAVVPLVAINISPPIASAVPTIHAPAKRYFPDGGRISQEFRCGGEVEGFTRTFYWLVASAMQSNLRSPVVVWFLGDNLACVHAGLNGVIGDGRLRGVIVVGKAKLWFDLTAI
jgi:hypothetical protein